MRYDIVLTPSAQADLRYLKAYEGLMLVLFNRKRVNCEFADKNLAN
jgi:hypothetical protein